MRPSNSELGKIVGLLGLAILSVGVLLLSIAMMLVPPSGPLPTPSVACLGHGGVYQVHMSSQHEAVVICRDGHTPRAKETVKETTDEPA